MIRFIRFLAVIGILFVQTAYSQTPITSRLSARRISNFTIPNAGSTIAFDPLLSTLAIARNDSRIGVYRASDGRQIWEFKKLRGVWPTQVGIYSISFLNDRNEILVMDSESRFMICDIKRRTVDRVIRLPWFVLENEEVATEFQDGQRMIGTAESAVLHGLRVKSVQVSPDEKYLVVCYQEGSIVLLDIHSGRLRKVVRKGSFQSNSTIAEIGKQVDLKLVEAIPEYFGMRVGKKAEWQIPKSIRIGGEHSKNDGTFLYFLGSAGDDVIIQDQDGLARLNLDSATPKWRTGCGNSWGTVTPDGRYAAFVDNSTIHVLRTSDGEVHRRIRLNGLNPLDRIDTVKAACNGTVFLLLSQTDRLFVVDERGKSVEITSADSKKVGIIRIAISADGKRIAILKRKNKDDKTVELFELQSKS